MLEFIGQHAEFGWDTVLHSLPISLNQTSSGLGIARKILEKTAEACPELRKSVLETYCANQDPNGQGIWILKVALVMTGDLETLEIMYGCYGKSRHELLEFFETKHFKSHINTYWVSSLAACAAVGKGQLATLQWIFSHSPPFPPSIWNKVAFAAASFGNVEILDWMKTYVGPGFLTAKLKDEMYLVHQACRFGQIKVLDWIISQVTEPATTKEEDRAVCSPEYLEKRGWCGTTPAISAVNGKSLACLRRLCEVSPSGFGILDAVTDGHDSVVKMAVRIWCPEIVDFLIEHHPRGVDAFSVMDRMKNNVLHDVMLQSSTFSALVQFFLDRIPFHHPIWRTRNADNLLPIEIFNTKIERVRSPQRDQLLQHLLWRTPEVLPQILRDMEKNVTKRNFLQSCMDSEFQLALDATMALVSEQEQDHEQEQQSEQEKEMRRTGLVYLLLNLSVEETQRLRTRRYHLSTLPASCLP